MKSVEENHSMKHRYPVIFLIIIVLSCTSVLKSATGLNKASLRIEIKNCRQSQIKRYPSLKDSLLVVKNDIPFQKLDGLNSLHTLSDLDTGLYTIHYTSIYGKEEKTSIHITTFKPYNITVWADSLDYTKETYIPIIDQLHDNDFYTIIMASDGCFSAAHDTLTIRKIKDKYRAIWKSNIPKFISHSFNLTPKQIETIRKFELELNYMNNEDDCTTIDTYTINYQATTKTIVDGSCSWRGYYLLREKLLGKNTWKQ
jgi:predicted DNA binding protein